MKFVRESAKAIEDVNSKQLEAGLRALRNTGGSTFATLEDPFGNYLQVAGGGIGCVIEKRIHGVHYRAYSDSPSVKFDDGTELVYSGGRIKLQHDEWFAIKRVIEVFDCFLRGTEDPPYVRWREQRLQPA